MSHFLKKTARVSPPELYYFMGVSIYRRIRIAVRLAPFGVRQFIAALDFLECGASSHRFDIFWIAARPRAALDISYSAANRAALDYIPTSPSFIHFYTPPLQQTSPQA